MAAVNYAEKYQRALAQAYPNVLRFGELYSIELKEIVAKGKRKIYYVLDVTYTNMRTETELIKNREQKYLLMKMLRIFTLM